MHLNRPRSFDPVVVGNRETDAWAAYYRHDWRRFLVASVGMVAAAFGMTPRRTLAGAWYVLRANQIWAPYPDNQPDAARAYMRRFYELVVQERWSRARPGAGRPARGRMVARPPRRPARRAVTEQLEDALIDLYAYVYERRAARPSARPHASGSRRWTCPTVGSGRVPSRRPATRAEERRALVRRTPLSARPVEGQARPPVIGRSRWVDAGAAVRVVGGTWVAGLVELARLVRR